MKINDLLIESKIEEAPQGMISRGLNKLGAKFLPGKWGSQAQGRVEAVTVANKLYKDYYKYLGGSNQQPSMDSMQRFLQTQKIQSDVVGQVSKKMPPVNPASMSTKEVEKFLMGVAQDLQAGNPLQQEPAQGGPQQAPAPAASAAPQQQAPAQAAPASTQTAPQQAAPVKQPRVRKQPAAASAAPSVPKGQLRTVAGQQYQWQGAQWAKFNAANGKAGQIATKQVAAQLATAAPDGTAPASTQTAPQQAAPVKQPTSPAPVAPQAANTSGKATANFGQVGGQVAPAAPKPMSTGGKATANFGQVGGQPAPVKPKVMSTGGKAKANFGQVGGLPTNESMLSAIAEAAFTGRPITRKAYFFAVKMLEHRGVTLKDLGIRVQLRESSATHVVLTKN